MWDKSIFRKKSFAQLKKESNSSSFVRELGASQLVLIGLGAVIGGGVFILPGVAAYQHAGPAVMLSFALAGIIAICAGLCYAEFATMIPSSGSSYTYTYATLGEFPGWLIGCSVIIAYFLAASSIANGWSSYLVGLFLHFGVYLPAEFTNVTGEVIVDSLGNSTVAVLNAPAFLVCIISMLVLYRGTSTSVLINSIVVTIKMFVLFVFVAIGIFKININNWSPFIPENTGVFGEFGLSGIVAGTSIIFLAYSGLDVVCTAAQETKAPQKNIPIGILGSIVISTLTYVLVATVLTGTVNYKNLNTTQPIALAMEVMDIPMLLVFIKFGALIAITSVVFAHQYAITRMLYSIANDGLLPNIFRKINKKHQTLGANTIIIGMLMAIVSSTLKIDNIVKLSTFFLLLSVAVVCLSTIYLRYKKPQIARSFRCPFMPYTPLIAIFCCGQILFSYPRAIVFYASGCIIVVTFVYLFYGRRHSSLSR